MSSASWNSVGTCPWRGSSELSLRPRTCGLIQRKPSRFNLEQCGECRHIFQNPGSPPRQPAGDRSGTRPRLPMSRQRDAAALGGRNELVEGSGQPNGQLAGILDRVSERHDSE